MYIYIITSVYIYYYFSNTFLYIYSNTSVTLFLTIFVWKTCHELTKHGKITSGSRIGSRTPTTS